MDIVLLLPVDPVSPWALSVEKHKCRSQVNALRVSEDMQMPIYFLFFFTILSLCFSCSLSEFYAGRLFSKLT